MRPFFKGLETTQTMNLHNFKVYLQVRHKILTTILKRKMLVLLKGRLPRKKLPLFCALPIFFEGGGCQELISTLCPQEMVLCLESLPQVSKSKNCTRIKTDLPEFPGVNCAWNKIFCGRRKCSSQICLVYHQTLFKHKL